MTEGKVVTDNRVPETEGAVQDVINEVLGRHLCETSVERNLHEKVRPERRDLPFPLSRQRKPERRCIGLEQHPRMGLERHDGQPADFGLGNSPRLPDDGMMAEVNPVEIADRGDRSPIGFCHGFQRSQCAQWPRLTRGWEP